VSLIVPVWRDVEPLARLLSSLTLEAAEVVVAVPGGEAPRYAPLVAGLDRVRLVEGPRGRASQMNAGASAAAGEWLLFLHADSRLPRRWCDAVRQAGTRADVVGGAFRFALDSTDWRARVLETAVRLRVRLLRLPYGDQGIFVRKTVFDALGGFADLPLMEDIDFVRRLRTSGRLQFCSVPVVTSARRWERDGWIRRSAVNMSLATRFLLGAPPSRLAQRYFGRRPSALVVMARAPWQPGKTRLRVADATAHAALRDALFFDTLDAAATLDGVDRLLACEPAADVLPLQAAVGPDWDVIAQRGNTLGDRMAHVFEDVFRLGYDAVIIVGSDLPDLPLAAMASARAHLGDRRDRVVLGPASDGGYYLVGLTRPRPELFSGIAWGTDHVLADTQAAADEAHVPTVLLEPWSDVDDNEDLARLAAHAPRATSARRTRAWLLEHAAQLEVSNETA
jgi:rSAM/selenodomain-associated transferase 2/rSAM/selenodomain-associated transferase 1